LLASAKVIRTSGDLTTTSTSFVDVTDMLITLTTGARRVLIVVNAVGHLNDSGADIALDISIDETRQGQTYGLAFERGGTSQNRNMSFSYYTPTLVPGRHKFKLMFCTKSSGTLTLYASTALSPLIMSATELPNNE